MENNEQNEQNQKKEDGLTKLKKGIDETLNKGKGIVDTAKEGAMAVTQITTSVQDTVNRANDLLRSAKDLKDTFVESKRIQAKTEIELQKIKSNHLIVNRIISEEYGKQKHSMDKAGDVVDLGIEKNDIAIIREGLVAMTTVANHNPMEKIKTELDKELERNLNQDFDDDFILE